MKNNKPEKSQYVAILTYQIPNRIVLDGRKKVSPKFDTMYGMIYWLNAQPVHMEYTIYKTNGDVIVREGFKKANERIAL
jgi:hypothetical protein